MNYIELDFGKSDADSILKNAIENLSFTEEEWQKKSWQFIIDWLDTEKSHIQVKTSGSTGEPKNILHSKEKMINSASMTCQFFDLKEGDKAFCCLPVTGIGGIMMIVRAFYQKMELIIHQPVANPLENIDFAIELMSVVPYQLAKILEENPEKLQLIKNLIVGGGAILNTHENKLIELGINAYHSFGMTETLSHIALRKVGESYFKLLPNVKVSTDEDSRLIIDAPDLLDASLLTNDLVKIVSKDEFEWMGRFDNAIETGGYKVLPEVLENKLLDLIPHRFFIDSLPHDTLNNQIVLVVEAESFSMEIEKLKEKLSDYEIPKKIICVPEFVLTESGKIKRKETLALGKN